jgi:SAM-dependent methyltransferase
LINNESQKQAIYNPHVFEVNNFEEAKQIILTSENGITSAERWEKETPFIVEQITGLFKPSENDILLDYGCGIGRLAKSLLQKVNCCVLGIDISLTMRQLAPAYVNSEHFSVCTPQVLDIMAAKGLKVDFIYAVWVLQHSFNPVDELLRIRSVLKEGGLFYVLNNYQRVVPTNKGWSNDGINVEQIISQMFKEIWSSPIPEWLIIPEASKMTFQKLYKKD